MKRETTPSGMEITHGSGNIFSDLGFDEEEAANLQVRSVLMQRLQEYVRSSDVTQKEVAERLGVHQPRVSLLMQGHIGEFSIDALVNMLAHVGITPKIDFMEPA